MFKYIYIIILLLFFSSNIQAIFAHELKTDNTVGAVLHIDPDDDPIAGETSNIYFEFKDRDNKFRTDNCTCDLTISKEGTPIFSSEIFGDSNNPTILSSATSFVFPETGNYQLKVSGEPKEERNFEPFTLMFEIQISRTKPVKSSVEPISNDIQKDDFNKIYYVGIGIVVIIILGFGLILRKRRE